MGIGISIFFVAVGAILAFAVETEVQGIDIATVGVILMVVGGIGLLLSLVLIESWRGWGRPGPGPTTREERVIRDY